MQVGLQGVDNGAMRFTNVRIPRDNLLDRFATVDRGGKYSSPYSPSRRFAATLGELTGGRVGLTCGSLGVLKVLSLSCMFYQYVYSMVFRIHASRQLSRQGLKRHKHSIMLPEWVYGYKYNIKRHQLVP